MMHLSVQSDEDLLRKIKWLMFSRVLFTTLLLGSTIILQLSETTSPLAFPLLALYALIAMIFSLSFIYTIFLLRVRHFVLFAYFQITIDTLIVTLIIFVTGSFSSIFSFLYLVVIIYSSILLYRKGSMIMAVLCSVEYAVLIAMEYYQLMIPLATERSLMAFSYPGSQVLYKILIVMVACFAVAFLSSLLAEQARRTKKELQIMEHHMKRVERLASIGELGAGLAHEIKNPLASLIGSIQLLRESFPYDPDHDMLMKIVLREADRLSSLVNNFLMFARPQVGKIEAIDLVTSMKEIIQLFEKDSTLRGGVTVQTRFTSGVWIEMDPGHLQQILWNLLINAAEAINGEGTIVIENDLIKHNFTDIKIRDSGCGMPPELLSSIFDPFFTTKPKGTGLGLSIVHSILESYDSWLDVESKQGLGTTFTLRLKTIPAPTKP